MHPFVPSFKDPSWPNCNTAFWSPLLLALSVCPVAHRTPTRLSRTRICSNTILYSVLDPSCMPLIGSNGDWQLTCCIHTGRYVGNEISFSIWSRVFVMVGYSDYNDTPASWLSYFIIVDDKFAGIRIDGKRVGRYSAVLSCVKMMTRVSNDREENNSWKYWM